jgi:hypothetical protein
LANAPRRIARGAIPTTSTSAGGGHNGNNRLHIVLLTVEYILPIFFRISNDLPAKKGMDHFNEWFELRPARK